MEEIRGLTRERAEGMLRLQQKYYAHMQAERERQAKAATRDFLYMTGFIGVLVLLFGTMLYFDMRDPPMYLEASDGTLSINPLYMEMVRKEQEQQLLDQYYEDQYYVEEEEY